MTTDSSRKNGTQHVYWQLKDLLINYQLAPGRHLHPNDFVDMMRVSCTPVRDAMHRLSGEHFLLFIPNRGFFTKAFDLKEMRELLFLETTLLERAALEFIEGDRTSRLKIDDLAQIRSPRNFCAAFEDGLEQLAYSTGNACMAQIVRHLLDRTHYVAVLEFEDEARQIEVASQFHEITNGMASRDAAGVTSMLRQQLKDRLQRLPDIVKEGLLRSHRSTDRAGPGAAISASSGARLSF